MAIFDGCEAQHRTPVPEDRSCPVCGRTVEVFTVKGRIREDAVCECGYVFKEGTGHTMAASASEE